MSDQEIKEIVNDLFDLQRKIFGMTWPDKAEDLVKEYHLLISVELAELVMETNFKPHKKMRQIDLSKVQDEAIDVLIYSLELCGALFDADFGEIVEALKRKTGYNQIRQDWEMNRAS